LEETDEEHVAINPHVLAKSAEADKAKDGNKK
jgi:hypothetical protein